MPALLDIRPDERRIDYGIRIAVALVNEARQHGGVETWVYFIQEDCEDGAIKVGLARNPPRRLSMLQTGNPNRLILRGLFWAPAALERILHRTFADDRLVGEWFAPVEALEAIADSLHYFSITDSRAASRLAEEPWGEALVWSTNRRVA